MALACAALFTNTWPGVCTCFAAYAHTDAHNASASAIHLQGHTPLGLSREKDPIDALS